MAQIVVLNDGANQDDVLAQLVRARGLDVITCGDTQSAYALLRMGHQKLIVLDVLSETCWSVWNFLTLLQIDRELTRTPIVICCGPSDELLAREEWLRTHQVRILSKPFDFDELHAVLEATSHG